MNASGALVGLTIIATPLAACGSSDEGTTADTAGGAGDPDGRTVTWPTPPCNCPLSRTPPARHTVQFGRGRSGGYGRLTIRTAQPVAGRSHGAPRRGGELRR
jgi:hypothetical protein